MQDEFWRVLDTDFLAVELHRQESVTFLPFCIGNPTINFWVSFCDLVKKYASRVEIGGVGVDRGGAEASSWVAERPSDGGGEPGWS